jgi:hypothetical protein
MNKASSFLLLSLSLSLNNYSSVMIVLLIGAGSETCQGETAEAAAVCELLARDGSDWMLDPDVLLLGCSSIVDKSDVVGLHEPARLAVLSCEHKIQKKKHTELSIKNSSKYNFHRRIESPFQYLTL